MVKERHVYKPHTIVDSSTTTESSTDSSRRREQLKQELQYVIESMGPGSPQRLQTNGFEADTENSSYLAQQHEDKEDYSLSLVATSIESNNVSCKVNKATSPCHFDEKVDVGVGGACCGAGEPCPCIRPPTYCIHHICHSGTTIPTICPCPNGHFEWFRNNNFINTSNNNIACEKHSKTSKENKTVEDKIITTDNKKAESKESKMSKSDKNFFKNFARKTARKATFFDGNTQRRVDFYYFDHGNAEYFHTTDSPPVMMCEMLAEKTENYTTKFWAEIFGSIHIFFSFAMSFILQFIRFILYSMVRPLTVGLMQLVSDYLFKPFLTTLFNSFVQPPLIFLYNIATSIRDLLDPIAEGVGYFFRELAVMFKSIRLCCVKKCECNHEHKCGAQGDSCV